jgi:hypothetical protein
MSFSSVIIKVKIESYTIAIIVRYYLRKLRRYCIIREFYFYLLPRKIIQFCSINFLDDGIKLDYTKHIIFLKKMWPTVKNIKFENLGLNLSQSG